jgi:4'-phosphopantetheinyl transferase
LPEFQFSISHAGPYVGVAFASAPCGLDLEPADRAVNPAVARRFAPAERDHVSSGPPSSQASRFLEIWTKKEAYLKWTGDGAGAGLATFSVLDPAGLGVVFLPLSGGPRDDLVGWVCARAEFGAAGLREEWSTAWID